MNEEETEHVEMKKKEYYFEHWHRILLPLLLYKNPAVASAENYSLSIFKAFEHQPIYFYVEFVKPGKQIYIVEHKEKPENSEKVLFEAFSQLRNTIAQTTKK